MDDSKQMPPIPDPSEWLDRYGSALYGFAFFRLDNANDAEEAVQETMLRGIRRLPTFEGRSSCKTWLTGILKNVLHETERRRGRDTGVGEVKVSEEAAMDMVELRKLSPDRAVERREFWEVVESCLEELPVRTARIFWEREVEGRSAEEVGRDLGMSGNAVGVALHRARKFMRDCVDHTLNFGRKLLK